MIIPQRHHSHLAQPSAVEAVRHLAQPSAVEAVRHVAAALIVTLSATPVLAEESMRILTYPIGLVVGELTVKVDLGPQGQPADLYLDGRRTCAMTVTSPACVVDLGPDPHVHLLELVRATDPAATDRVERWVNRPGQEAELSLTMMPPAGETCGARIGWAHPLRQDPVELTVTLGAEVLELGADRRSLRFPCPASERSPVLVASGIFPDGRRVEAAAVIGGFSGEASVDLTAVSLVSDADESPCEAWPAEGLGAAAAQKIDDSGYEVVLVLDPAAAYRPIFGSGQTSGRGPAAGIC